MCRLVIALIASCIVVAPAAAASPGAPVRTYEVGDVRTTLDRSAVAATGAAIVEADHGSVTVTAAPNGSPTRDGLRVRVDAIGGTYSYPGRSVATRVTGYQQEGALQAGYEWVWKDAALAGFIGFNVRSNQLSIPDPGNPVVGTGVGLKVAGNFYATPTDRTMISAYGSYSTKFNAYYSRLRVGYMLADGVYIGPEALFLGDDFFRQYRIGAHLTGVRFGPVQMSVAAGYVRDRVQGSGYYSSIEARSTF